MNGTTTHEFSYPLNASGLAAHDAAMANPESDSQDPDAEPSDSRHDDPDTSSGPFDGNDWGPESDDDVQPRVHVIHYVRRDRRYNHRVQKYDSNRVDDLRTTSIFASLSALRSSGKFSDLTISCGGRDFKVHRVIVCSQSPVFYAALAEFTNRVDNVLELPKDEDDPDVFERLLEFLYTGTYTPGGTAACNKPADASLLEPAEVAEQLSQVPGVDISQGASTDNESYEDDAKNEFAGDIGEDVEEDEPEGEGDNADDGSDEEDPDAAVNLKDTEAPEQPEVEEKAKKDLFLALHLYVMANKYEVPTLQLLARNRFYRAAELTWKEAEWFPDVVDEIYSTIPATDVRLREIVCRLVGAGIHDDHQRMRMGPVMAKHGDFALGVLNYLVEKDKEVW